MASLAEISQYYPNIQPKYSVDGPSVFGEPDSATMELIGQIPKGGRVLEVGAGDGRYTLPMAEMGLDVIAGDIDSVALDTLRKKAEKQQGRRLPIAIFNGFEPFPLKEVDAVVNTALLYLLPEKHIREFTSAAHGSLKKDGLLVVDFVTNRKRVGVDGEEIRGENEIGYDLYSGLQTIGNVTDDLFKTEGLKFSHVNQDLRATAGYTMTAEKISILARKR